MADYSELADYVQDWANRDIGVLSYKTIRQCIKYAHDECYRTLRIAPMEITRKGIVDEQTAADGYLEIADDLVEFIQLRKNSTRESTSYSPFYKPYIVAEAHADVRSFRGDSVTLYSDYAFYREDNKIYIYPQIKENEEWEMYYYRRLPEVNERGGIQEFIFDVPLDNENSEDPDADPIYTPTADQFNEYFDVLTDAELTAAQLRDPGNFIALEEQYFTDAFITFPDDFTFPTGNVVGRLKSNWLRDDNEKALLFGALYQAFDYLDEPEQTGKYKGKFEQEIAKLNKQEMDRQNSGGNLNVNFYNRLI